MKALSHALGVAGVWWGIVTFTAQPSPASAQTVDPQVAAGEIRIESIQGIVEVNPGGNTQWRAVLPGHALRAGDRLRTRERSRVAIRWSDQSVVRLAELSDVHIQAAAARQRASFSLVAGILYFFNRERLTNARYGTRTASAAIRGTEFVLQAEENGRTTLTVIEGEVELSNEVDAVTLRRGEQGVAEPGQPPRKTPAIIVNNIIQWALYYPAVLELDELGLTLAERNRLTASIAAYNSGELLRALALLPAQAVESSAEKIYRAGLFLAVGDVAEAEQMLDTVADAAEAGGSRSVRLAGALRELIAAVKVQPWATNTIPELSSEWLARSYSHQGRGELPNALNAARQSVEISPQFGFGWTRVAELEFSFGHLSRARDALERGLKYSPRNAQALALKGFVLAAQNRITEAISWFNRAIAVDPNLANAWLGRGLCLIRQGHSERGRENLLTAVAMEPQRAILRSYLAKAYTDAGDEERAAHELQIAKDIDPNDPTAWLYSALLNEQDNRINDAVRDLEKSQELTGNRHIYRSGLLLDQDRAVRSANLARIYQDAGMQDVAIREASRAVLNDYGNFSAHLFLADSYSQLVDPRHVNVRFQTPALSEYLLANLLAPAGAGPLSQTISQHEYATLFETDGVGLLSRTDYSSNGDWLQTGAQFGNLGRTAYAVEGSYRAEVGQRPNNDLLERLVSMRFKQQIWEENGVYVQATFSDAKGGDLELVPYDFLGNTSVRIKAEQDPLVLAGYHHQWSPGNHSLLLAGHLEQTFSVTDLQQQALLVSRPFGFVDFVSPLRINGIYRQSSSLDLIEGQHIWRSKSWRGILGLRLQTGDFHTRNLQRNPSDFILLFDLSRPAADQEIETKFNRYSAYNYLHWAPHERFDLVGGITYDRLKYPFNYNAPPVSEGEEETDRVSPSAGFSWKPTRGSLLSGSYTRALAGAAGDQSFQLEPAQIAGFPRTYQSLGADTLSGPNPGARFETYNLSWSQRFKTETYVEASAQLLQSKTRRNLGTFTLFDEFGFVEPSTTRNQLDFREQSVSIALHHLLGDEWAFGVLYRIAESDIHDRYPDVTSQAFLANEFRADYRVQATLHKAEFYAMYNHPSGFFGEMRTVWYDQSVRGFAINFPGDNFWHVNFLGGKRFFRRRAELAVGILNVTDEDYHLVPLSYYAAIPRDRTLIARFKVAF